MTQLTQLTHNSPQEKINKNWPNDKKKPTQAKVPQLLIQGIHIPSWPRRWLCRRTAGTHWTGAWKFGTTKKLGQFKKQQQHKTPWKFMKWPWNYQEITMKFHCKLIRYFQVLVFFQDSNKNRGACRNDGMQTLVPSTWCSFGEIRHTICIWVTTDSMDTSSPAFFCKRQVESKKSQHRFCPFWIVVFPPCSWLCIPYPRPNVFPKPPPFFRGGGRPKQRLPTALQCCCGHLKGGPPSATQR